MMTSSQPSGSISTILPSDMMIVQNYIGHITEDGTQWTGYFQFKCSSLRIWDPRVSIRSSYLCKGWHAANVLLRSFLDRIPAKGINRVALFRLGLISVFMTSTTRTQRLGVINHGYCLPTVTCAGPKEQHLSDRRLDMRCDIICILFIVHTRTSYLQYAGEFSASPPCHNVVLLTL